VKYSRVCFVFHIFHILKVYTEPEGLFGSNMNWYISNISHYIFGLNSV
jgi:hypothetical protein